MKKINRRVLKLGSLLILLLLNVFILNVVKLNVDDTVSVELRLNSTDGDSFQLFYKNRAEWDGNNSLIVDYTNPNNSETLVYKVPLDTTDLRIDLGTIATEMTIEKLIIKDLISQIDLIGIKDINQLEMHDIGNLKIVENVVKVTTTGNDPYIVFKDINLSGFNQRRGIINILYKLFTCIIVDIAAFVTYRKRNMLKSLIVELWGNKRLIINLAKNDFKTKYAGSYLGITWAFVQPIITILIYWFVFQIGFRTPPVGNFPYVLWLIAGLIPWFVFSDAISNAAYSLIEYNYLVKKVVFKISVLPMVKVISAFFVHLFFIVFGIVVFSLYGYTPTIYTLQIIYYAFCLFFIILGTSYATSAIIIFFKDLSQIINIILQVTMWMTPILWNQTILPTNLQWIFKLNPIFYIVQGYRDCFIDKVWFWQRTGITIYFWVITIGIFAIGSVVFKRLKVHFADVL
nr:ABC transporter permease [uncultured Cellulosilyticum sp.]